MPLQVNINGQQQTSFDIRLLNASRQSSNTGRPTVSQRGAKRKHINSRLGTAVTMKANLNVGAYDKADVFDSKPAIVSIPNQGGIGS